MLNKETISKNFKEVQLRIAQAKKTMNRERDDVDLIIVSKTRTAEEISPLLEQGHKNFGENKVQEAETKWPKLKAKFPFAKLHLIGPLQSNKVKRAVGLFDVIETIDREKIAERVSKEISRQQRTLQCYVQLNTGEETQKAGVHPSQADVFIKMCRNDFLLPVSGLMCIPPSNSDPSPHFSLLLEIAERNQISNKSMGMSSDYELAIKLGSTEVRIGTGIFGKRDYPSL